MFFFKLEKQTIKPVLRPVPDGYSYTYLYLTLVKEGKNGFISSLQLNSHTETCLNVCAITNNCYCNFFQNILAFVNNFKEVVFHL